MRGFDLLLTLTIAVTASTALGDEREAVLAAVFEDDTGKSLTAAEFMTEPGPVLMVLVDDGPFSKRYLQVLADESETLRTGWGVRTVVITEALTPARRPDLDEFIASRAWPFEVYFDTNHALPRPFEVTGFPTSILWSDDREIRLKSPGALTADDLQGMLDAHFTRVGPLPFDATKLDDIAGLIGTSLEYVRERCGEPLEADGGAGMYEGFSPTIDMSVKAVQLVVITPAFQGEIPGGFRIGATMTELEEKLGAPASIASFGKRLHRSAFPKVPGIEFVHDLAGTVHSLIIMPGYMASSDADIPAERIIDSTCTPEAWGGVSGDFIIRMLGRDRSHYLPVAWLERVRGVTPFVVQENPWHGIYAEEGLAIHMTENEILRVDIFDDFEGNGVKVEAFTRQLPCRLEFGMPIDIAETTLQNHYAAHPRGKQEDPDGTLMLTYSFTAPGQNVPYFVGLASHRDHRTLSGVTVAIAPNHVADVKETDAWCQVLNWAIGRSADNYKNAGGDYRKDAAGKEMKGLIDVREIKRMLPGAIDGVHKQMSSLLSDESIEYLFYDGHDKHAARAAFDEIKVRLEGCDVCGFQIIEGVAEDERDQSRPEAFIVNWRLDRYRFKPRISEPRDVILDMNMEFRSLIDAMRRYRVTLRIGAEF